MSQGGILNISSSAPSIPTSFVTNSGVATPASNTLNVIGGTAISTSGSGDTLTIEFSVNLDQYHALIGGPADTIISVAPSATPGVPLISQGSSAYPTFSTVGVVGGGTGLSSITAHNLIVGNDTLDPNLIPPSAISGIPLISQGSLADPVYGTASVAGGGTGLTSIAANNLLVGNETSSPNLIPPNATSGIPLISLGAGNDPNYGTAVVEGGGTGITSTTAYGVLTGGTTATDPFQNAGAGTAGQFLQSNGAGALPTWGGPSPEAYFAATRTTNTTNVTGDASPLSPMIFDTVLANKGSGYNPATGFFTAPSDGLYFFSVTIRMQGITSSHTLERLIIRAGAFAYDGYRNPFPSYNVLGTPSLTSLGSGVLSLTAGTNVFVDWLVQGGTKTVSIYANKCTFFGYKVGDLV